MEQINQLIKKSLNQKDQQEPQSTTSEVFLVAAWNSLKNMGLIHEDVGTPMYKTWKRGLEVIPEADISRGLRKATQHKGFFNLPAFVALCEPQLSDYGLPEPEEAYTEAAQATYPVLDYKFSHPAVYHAGADTGWFELRKGAGKDQFKHAYTRRTEQVMGGIQLKIPENKLIEQDKGVLPGRERTREHIEALRELLG